METTISSTNTQPIMLKKALKTIRVVFHHLKTVISNTNLLLLLNHPLLKRGNKLAGKAIDSLLLSFICTSRTDPIRSIPVLKEYEFSCSNSPAFQLIPAKLRRHVDRRRCRYHHVDKAAVAAAVQRVFEMLNGETPVEGNGSAAVTPMVLPGFGKSPAVPVRQLRVTDSPFPVMKNEEESKLVSKASEEFIRKFYMDLIKEKSFESPYRHIH